MRKSKKGGMKMRGQRGEGFFGDLWSGIKRVGNIVPWRQVGNFIKDNKLVSKGLAMTPARGLAPIASAVGLGKKKRKGGARKRPSMRGGGMVNSVTRTAVPSVIRV